MMEAVGGGNSIFYLGNTSPGGVDIRGLDRSVDAWLIEDSRLTRSEEHTSELQSLMRTSYAVFCLKKKKKKIPSPQHTNQIDLHMQNIFTKILTLNVPTEHG